MQSLGFTPSLAKLEMVNVVKRQMDAYEMTVRNESG